MELGGTFGHEWEPVFAIGDRNGKNELASLGTGGGQGNSNIFLCEYLADPGKARGCSTYTVIINYGTN